MDGGMEGGRGEKESMDSAGAAGSRPRVTPASRLVHWEETWPAFGNRQTLAHQTRGGHGH